MQLIEEHSFRDFIPLIWATQANLKTRHLRFGVTGAKHMTAMDKRPKNREVEDEMIRKPAKEHVPPVPATAPAKETTQAEKDNVRSNT